MNLIRLESHSLQPTQTSIIQKYVPQNSTALGAAVVRLFFAEVSKPWMFSKIEGILLFLVDRLYQTNFLRIIDPKDPGTALFQTETYVNFSEYIKEPCQNFTYFPIKGGFAGLLFAKAQDANLFHNLFDTYCVHCDPEQLPDLRKKYHKDAAILRKAEGYIHSEEGEEGRVQGFSIAQLLDYKEAPIGRPIEFQEVNNAWWDSSTQKINVKRLPPEIKKLFKIAGITKRDLKDKETAVKIFEIIMSEELLNLQKIQTEKNPPNFNQRHSMLFDRSKVEKRIRQQNRNKAAQQGGQLEEMKESTASLMDMHATGSVLGGTGTSAIPQIGGGSSSSAIPIPPPQGSTGGLIPPPPPPPGRMASVAVMGSQSNLQSGPALSMQEQLAKSLKNLKPVQAQEKQNKKMSNERAIVVSSTLAQVIEDRRLALGKDYQSDDDDDDEDDDDDDYD